MELVSIITPLYNAEKWILETANSVKAQTYSNWEWIIVNDCSTDSSLKLVEELAATDGRIKVITNSVNLKTAKTRNRGIREAKGRYIAFIDSDDIWVPEKLEKQISFMKKNGVSFSYHAYKKFRDSLACQGAVINVPESVDYKELLKTNSIACLSAIYDVEILGKIEMPDGYKAREDYLTWLKILRTRNIKAYGLSDCLGYYRILNNSYSGNKIEVSKIQWKLYREVEKLNLFQAIPTFIFYLLNGFLKYRVI